MGNLQRVITLHQELSGRIKQYENITTEFPPEVLNELRYALRAILQCEVIRNSKSSDRRDEDFKLYEERAFHALCCAYHDLIDALSIEITDNLEVLTTEYLNETITVLGSTRLDIIKTLDDVNALKEKSRKNIDVRENIYHTEIYPKYFEQLCQYHKLIKTQSEAILLLYHKNQDKEKKYYRYAICGLIIGILGCAIGIIGFLS